MRPDPASSATERRARREGGASLVLAILGIVLMMALTAGLTMIVFTETQAVAESSRRMSAFYLAESGFEAAKYEIGESSDPDSDGMGNVTAVRTEGSYSVTALSLGNDRYELTSTGTSGTTSVTLKSIAVKSASSILPPSALAILGPSDDINIELNPSITLEGGDSAAVVLTDQATFDVFGSSLLGALTQATSPLGSLLGGVTSTLSTQALPVLLSPPSSSGEICNGVYTNFVNRMRGTVIPSLPATSLSAGSSITLGTSAAPVTVYWGSASRLQGGQTLTGHGTLIVADELRVDPYATFNWTGNVIVLSQNLQDAKLDIRGNATVNGSVTVAAAPSMASKLILPTTGQLTVNGALTLMSDFTSTGRVDVSASGPLHVDGLFQALAVEHRLDFSTASDFILNGQMGLGPALDASLDSRLDLKLNGYTALYKDTQKIAQGATALAGLDEVLGQAVMATGLTHPIMTTEAWWVFQP